MRVLALLLLLVGGAAQAHPLAPALLQLRETAPASYDVLWRTSVSRVQSVDVMPQLPADCRDQGAVQAETIENESMLARWRVQCDASLVGRRLAVSGIERSGINVILRIETEEGAVIEALLDAARPDFIVPAPQAATPVFAAYLQLGVGHLLGGYDHLLFLLGLLLLVKRLRPLLLTVTAFTLGHSITLSLATLGWIRIDPALTEFGIALSILLLARELLRPAGLLTRKPWQMACAFGLLHGLGFAGALAEVGLPQREIPLALLAFNLGIELGQVLIVVLALGLARSWQQWSRPLAPPRLWPLLPAYVIGTLAAYWCFERAAALIA